PMTFPASATQAPRPAPVGLEQLQARDRAKAAGDSKASIQPFRVEYPEGSNVGYRWYEIKKEKPLFSFGYGLSYSTFRYSKLRVTAGSMPRVSIEVTNTGKRFGADVPQVYVRAGDEAGALTWRLAGFARVELAPGETKRVSVELEPRTFGKWV